MENKKTSDLIQWDFSISMGGLVSRYGRLSGVYLKQFLPGGIEFPERHPPRAIDGRSYNLAKKIAEKRGG